MEGKGGEGRRNVRKPGHLTLGWESLRPGRLSHRNHLTTGARRPHCSLNYFELGSCRFGLKAPRMQLLLDRGQRLKICAEWNCRCHFQ